MTRRIAKGRLLVALVRACALAAAACGPGVEEGPVPDAGAGSDSDSDTDTDTDTDTDSDSDTETDGPACPSAPTALCSEEVDPPFVLLEAETIAPDLELVDFDDGALLGRIFVGDVPSPVVVAAAFEADPEEILATIGIAELAAPGTQEADPVAIVSGLEPPFDDGGRRTVALIRRAGGYALVGADAGIATDGVIEVVAGGSIPTDGALRGIVYLRRKVVSSALQESPEFNRICAFGDGLFCFDGTSWETEIPAGTGPTLNAVVVLDEGDEGHIVAVGDDGRIAIEGPSGWQELDAGVEVDLRAASAHFDRFTAAGGKGAIVDGDAAGQLVCEGFGVPFASISWRVDLIDDEARYFMALSAEGDIVHGRIGEGAGKLCDSGDDVPGAFVGRLLGDYYYAMTAEALVARSSLSSSIPVE